MVPGRESVETERLGVLGYGNRILSRSEPVIQVKVHVRDLRRESSLNNIEFRKAASAVSSCHLSATVPESSLILMQEGGHCIKGRTRSVVRLPHISDAHVAGEDDSLETETAKYDEGVHWQEYLV
jgi:hypothetical protein